MTTPPDNGGIDPSLYRAMGHPTRHEILHALKEPGAVLAPVEFAERVGVPVQKVSYHFRVLVESGLIELVREEPVRGAVKHVYRANRCALSTNSPAWAALRDSSAKTAVVADVLTSHLKAAGKAIDTGAFERRDDAHFSWDEIVVDEKGLAKISKLVADFRGRLLGIEEECAPRIEQGNPHVNAIYAIGSFESPPTAT